MFEVTWLLNVKSKNLNLDSSKSKELHITLESSYVILFVYKGSPNYPC